MKKDKNEPGMFSMWKYDVMLNRDASRVVLLKFDRILHRICKQENIKVRLYDSIEKLNADMFNETARSEFASGVYSYSLDKTTKKIIINESIPFISLPENYEILTFCHELGHHFAIKNFYDRSEETADHFIHIIAENQLSNLERYILSTYLDSFSRLELPLPKIRRKEWRKFKKEHKID